MGGKGSGYPVWKDGKTTVEQCLHLDSVWLAITEHLGRRITADIAWTSRRTGAKRSGADLVLDLRDPYEPLALITYRHMQARTLYRQRIPLTPTVPYFGGLRWWFRCPLCGRRVRKLYMPDDDRRFACRCCFQLTYDSCQDSHRWDRLFLDIAKEVYGEGSDDHVARISRGLMARMRT